MDSSERGGPFRTQAVLRTVAPSVVGWVAAVCIALSPIGVVQAQPPDAAARGVVPIGGMVEDVVRGTASGGYGLHAYTIDVPPGATSLTVTVDSDGEDLDLAVRVGGPIATFDDVDFLDLSVGGDPSFRVDAPPAGVVHVEIFNLTEEAIPYAVTVSAEGVASQVVTEPVVWPAPRTSSGGPMPSAEYGPVGPVSETAGVLPAAADVNAYHSFWIDVPDGVRKLSIDVDGMGADLDLALRAGDPITSYDEVDYLGTGPEPNPGVEIDIIRPVRIYVDVMSFAPQATPYRLLVDVTAGAVPEDEAASGSEVEGPNADGSDAEASAPANPLTQPPRNPLAPDPWAGRFEGDGLEVILERVDAGYEGELALGNARYPLQATVDAGRMLGSFVSGGTAFAFEGDLDGDALRIESGGATFRTVRQSD